MNQRIAVAFLACFAAPKPGLQFAPLPTGLPECGPPYRPAACATVSENKK